MAAKVKDIEFPVGDDPHDPTVLLYWEEVVKRMRVASLPADLASWADAIQDRIDTFYRTHKSFEDAFVESQNASSRGESAARQAELDQAADRCHHELQKAVFEFARLKWKLSLHFGRHFDLTGPAVRALFAPRETHLRN